MAASISATSASLGPTWRGTKLSAAEMVLLLVVVVMQALRHPEAPCDSSRSGAVPTKLSSGEARRSAPSFIIAAEKRPRPLTRAWSPPPPPRRARENGAREAGEGPRPPHWRDGAAGLRVVH